VVVNPIREPVLLDQHQVQVPRVHRFRPGLDDFLCPIVQGDTRDPGRAADALLAAGVADVDEQVVHRDIGATEGTNGIDQEELAPLPNELPYVPEGLADSR